MFVCSTRQEVKFGAPQCKRNIDKPEGDKQRPLKQLGTRAHGAGQKTEGTGLFRQETKALG